MTTFPIPHAVERFLGLTAPLMLKARNLTVVDVDRFNRLIVEAPEDAQRRLAEEVRDADSDRHPWAGLAKTWARRHLVREQVAP